MATMSDAGYNCNNWKKMTGPCEGCVFTSGDMAGKCKRTGQYHDKSACVKAGGTWCKLLLHFKQLHFVLNNFDNEISFESEILLFIFQVCRNVLKPSIESGINFEPKST